MGSIESGVRLTLTKLGILEPVEALECLAVYLAQRLDNDVDDKSLSSVAQQLRLTLEKIESQPRPTNDAVEDIASRY